MKTGQIVTFYSYKGGVGRTMSLANIAVVLARWGKKVLIVDWDLEAPGIDPYFKEYTNKQNMSKRGVIDLLSGKFISERLAWKKLINILKLRDGKEEIHFLCSGKGSKDYLTKIRNLNIVKFYESNNGFEIIEKLREEWKATYDFILIDSRTGITDNGGICTIQMPDILILFFTANDQSLVGTKDIIERVNKGHQSQPFDRKNIITVPILSRFDTSTEFKISQEWINYISESLKDVYNDWLPSVIDRKEFIENTKIPYIPYFSFGEKISVIEQGTTDPTSMGYAYESIAALIACEFDNLEIFIKDRSKYIEKSISRNEGIDIDFEKNISKSLLISMGFDELTEIYREVKINNSLSLGLFNTIIEKAPDLNFAMAFYNDMKSSRIQPNDVTFNSLINKSPDYKHAKEFFNSMKSLRIQPSVVTFNSLINKSPDYKHAMEFYFDMRSFNVQPNEAVYNSLINLTPDYRNAIELFYVMQYSGIQPNEVTFNSLINMAPDYKQAKEFLFNMKSLDIQPSEVTYNTLINKAPNYRIVKELYSDLLCSDLKLSEVLFSTLISKAPDFKKAKMFFNDMKNTGIIPSEITFNALFEKAYNNKSIIETYKEMKDLGIAPSESTYIIISKALQKFERNKEALEMLIEGNSRYPESFILNLKLAKAYLELYELDKAAIIYDDILKKFEYKFTIKEVEAIFSDD